MLDLPPEQATIIVTASRTPEAEDATPASVTLIDAERIERLGAPLVTDLLRLSPSLAVSVSGPAGSLTDVRIRGAEANHTCCSSTASAPTTPPRAMRRASNCSTPTLPAGSRSCAGRNRRCGDPKRSAA